MVPWHSLEPTACEKFVSIMLLRQYPDGWRRRPSRGDGGVDVIVPVDGQPGVVDIYQIKYYYQSLTASQRAKVVASAEELKRTARITGMVVRDWNLTLPIDPTSDGDEWIRALFSGTKIEARWKGLTYLEGLAAKYRDVVDYYIFGGQERTLQLAERALSVVELMRMSDGAGPGLDFASMYNSAKVLFDQLNDSTDPHFKYSYSMTPPGVEIDALNLPKGCLMRQIGGIQGGPTMCIDVFPWYNEVLFDRPLSFTMSVDLSSASSELQEEFSSFRRYGTPIDIPGEYVTVEADGPLIGPSGNGRGVRVYETPLDGSKKFRVAVRDEAVDLAESVFSLRRASRGSEGGLFALISSEFDAIQIESRIDDPEAGGGLVRCTVRTEWSDKIAVRIVDEVRFAAMMTHGRSLAITPEFGGKPMQVFEIDRENFEAAPGWLVHYVSSLVSLQRYASGPLRTYEHDIDMPKLQALVDGTNALAALVSGNELLYEAGHLVIESPEYENLAADINRDGWISFVEPLEVNIGAVCVTLPSVRRVCADVTATVGTTDDGRDVVVVSGRDGPVRTRFEIVTGDE